MIACSDSRLPRFPNRYRVRGGQQPLRHDNRFELTDRIIISDRAETVVWGKAVADVEDSKRTAIVAKRLRSVDVYIHAEWLMLMIMCLQMDDEWNRKLLELLADGRLKMCSVG